MVARPFKSPGHALCYMVECTMASLARARMVKRTSKSEIARLESIVTSGLAACRTFKLAEAANETRCPRVAQALKEPAEPVDPAASGA